jgi:hypothetical protein
VLGSTAFQPAALNRKSPHAEDVVGKAAATSSSHPLPTLCMLAALSVCRVAQN